mmetsp:Transcript_21213/g.44822  ORF Transcript_21213/g.44822 Transcript_21213/m.44822 type:complete len:95 (+) Transcript_21213:438-722(+)
MNNEGESDSDGGGNEPVGYARKQARSTAFWGPRRTPISCAIKKKILKEKRKVKKEKRSGRLCRHEEGDVTNGRGEVVEAEEEGEHGVEIEVELR